MPKAKPFIYSRLTNDHYYIGVLHVGRRVIPWAVVLISFVLISAALGVWVLLSGSSDILVGFLVTSAALGALLGMYTLASWMYRVTANANRVES